VIACLLEEGCISFSSLALHEFSRFDPWKMQIGPEPRPSDNADAIDSDFALIVGLAWLAD
jgi:hypothetical protein